MEGDAVVPRGIGYVGKAIVFFSERVGVPTLAFLLIFYLCADTIRKNTKAITECTEAISKLSWAVERMRR